MAQEGGALANDNAQNSQTVEQPEFEQSFFEEIGSPLDFGAPWMLGTLPPALLIAFLLMRSIERRPKEVDFPAIFILDMLDNKERDTDRMPLWQQMINYAAISAAVMGAADPSWNPQEDFGQDGPVILAMDNGWDSAGNWDAIQERAQDILRQAHNDDRQVVLVQMATHEGDGYKIMPPMDAGMASRALAQMNPMPWQVDYEALSAGLDTLNGSTYGVSYWLGSGLDNDDTQGFATELNTIAPLRYIENDPASLPLVLGPAKYEDGDYRITVRRAVAEESYDFGVSAYAQDNTLLASHAYSFAGGQDKIDVYFDVPDLGGADKLSSEVFRFSINAQQNAAAQVIVDDQWRSRSVGLVVERSSDTDSLLSEARFIKTALDPHSELFLGRVEELIDSGDISVLVVPDAVTISGVAASKIHEWVESGGTLVRFAGPNMARSSHENDPLLPVDLRQGVHSPSSNANEYAGIGRFDPSSPLRGIQRDVSAEIHKQIMVEPGPDVSSKIWASLDDGTPLISADQRGEGRVVLFHTSANTAWGEFSLSDNFVDILLEVVSSSKSIQNSDALELTDLPPFLTMNGYGSIENPPPYAVNLQSKDCKISSSNPPGLYGSSLSAVACNLSSSIADIKPLGDVDSGIEREFYEVANNGYDLKGAAWSLFIALMLASTAVVMSQQGEFRRGRGKPKNSAVNNKNNAKPIHEAFMDDPRPDL